MNKVTVYNKSGESTGQLLELEPAIFNVAKARPELVHQAVVAMLANRRRPVASTKTRGEVRGGGKKPWKQKGTGRARAGSIRSPLWRGGGVIFGPSPKRNFSKKINRQMKHLAVLAALTDKAQAGQIFILESFDSPEAKTKIFAKQVQELSNKLNLGKKVLIIAPQRDPKLVSSARNLPRVKLAVASELSLLEVLWADSIIIVKESLSIIKEKYVV